MSDVDQVEDSNSPITIVEFTRRQLALIERQMLSATDLADLIDLSITGIRQLSGGSDVEVWLHDPVGELDRHLDKVGVLSGTVLLIDDSYSFVSLYSENPEWNRTTSTVFNGTELFKSAPAIEQTLMLPVLDHELLVGSIHVGNARSAVMMDENQMSILSDFVAKMPLLINRLLETNRIRDFVLLDPASHVATRAGLLRDLEREISRARRNNKAPLLVALKLVDLESIGNLSQRHIQHRILRTVASRVASGLRDTDSVARISEECFGVMLVDAPSEEASKIVERWEAELRGQLIDDGAGGIFELQTQSSFKYCDLASLEGHDSSELAHSLLNDVEQALF
ncbi:MAG: GGDEF domain-containing protein [Halieaceae bacterium]